MTASVLWEKLLSILLESINMYKILLELAGKKREVLVAVKPRDLEAITKQEDSILINANKIESARLGITSEIATLYGIEANAITLKSLIEKADLKIAPQLADAVGNLDKILNELAAANKLNSELIQQSLNYVNYNINILAQTVSEQTYAPKGNENQPGTSRIIFDAKV